jgi:carbonic anhydrase/acetyltransferase-like protein (isoleucine patch superfamily)
VLVVDAAPPVPLCGLDERCLVGMDALVLSALAPVPLCGLDERCLVGMDAPVLSALAGARGERSALPYERKEQKS